MEVYIHTYINVIYIYVCVYREREKGRESYLLIWSLLPFTTAELVQDYHSRLLSVFALLFWVVFFLLFCSLSFTCTVLLSNHQVIHGNFLLRTLCWWLVKARVRDNFLRPMRLSSRRQPPFSAHRLHSHQCPSHLLESLLFLGHQGGSGTKVFVLAPPWRRRAHLVHTQLGHSLPSGPPSRPPSQRRFHPLFTK